jgi:hypothetical protein
MIVTNVSLTEHTIFTVQLDWNHTRDREYPRFWGRSSGSVEITVNCLTRICPIWSALEEGMSRFLPCPHSSSSERSMLAFISALPSASWFEKKQARSLAKNLSSATCFLGSSILLRWYQLTLRNMVSIALVG